MIDDPLKVLLVEDRPEDADLVLLELRRGEILCEATRVETEADYLDRLEPSIDLIISDFSLPRFDAMRALSLRQERAADVPFIIVSGSIGEEIAVAAMREGADDYLLKDRLIRLPEAVRMAMSRRRLTEGARLSEQRLRVSREEMIQTLARAAERRDEETGFHIARMSRYCRVLCWEMGMDSARSDLVALAATMHDVGKIGIPDGILFKPGRYSPEEFDIMKRHAEYGAEILSGSEAEVVTLAAAIALCHHERWDGSGYPKGLVEEDIPFEGRIAAVADVFDALMTDRPYKRAFTLDEAVDVIKDGSGTHFDPQIVPSFLGALDELMNIRRDFEKPEDIRR